ncbi:MAG: VOC family protein [Desulfobacteraceae bacterium]|jgi:lactoylglutathione lyase
MRIEHVALWANDIEVLKTFYEKFFNAKSGKKYSNPSKKFSSYFLSFDSGARLEIMQLPAIPDAKNNQSDPSLGYTHLAISVGSIDKVNGLTSQLLENGFKVLDGPRRTGDGYYESVILDPENNRIEITV